MSALLFLALAPAVADAQNVSVDESAFRIYRNGEPVGKEEFSIRRIGRGVEQRLILHGTVDLSGPEGNITLAPAMGVRAGSLSVLDYQIKVAGAETTDIFVTVSGNRFLARTLSSEGEQLREFRAGSGSVLLDEGVVHHHYLLAAFIEGEATVSVNVLTPRAGTQQRMTLSFEGEEEIRIGGSLVPGARRFHLEGGDASRDIWLDDQGRILRLEIPSQGYLAERESISRPALP
jgi:hypothetical protein